MIMDQATRTHNQDNHNGTIGIMQALGHKDTRQRTRAQSCDVTISKQARTCYNGLTKQQTITTNNKFQHIQVHRFVAVYKQHLTTQFCK